MKECVKLHVFAFFFVLMIFSIVCWMKFMINMDIDSNLWADNIWHKRILSSMDSLFTYITTGEIVSDQVLLGKDQWLFYRTKTDGDTIGDYEGTSLFTEYEINRIKQSVQSVQMEMEERNISFLVLICPNKENIYYDYMPEIYTHSCPSRTDLLVDFLKKEGINIIDIKEELTNYKKSFQLYYKYDTHWNQLGAYIGVKSALEVWEMAMPPLESRILIESNNYSFEDDLAMMLGLTFIFDDEIEYEVTGTKIINWERYEDEQEHNAYSYFRNSAAPNGGGLLLVGDSFRSAMIPALSETFKDIYVVHRDNFRPETMDRICPDYVIVEYVERYSECLSEINKIF